MIAGDKKTGVIDAAAVFVDKQQELGTGGYGKVYKGTYGGHDVAIKTVVATRDTFKKLLQHEAKLWKKLVHPGIVTLFGVFTDGSNIQYLVMERMKTSLEDEIYPAGGKPPPTLQRRIRWMVQIAGAFVYLHNLEPPVIHADLKPNNILIDYNDRAKLTDFGIARTSNPSINATSVPEHGSAAFSPPESFAANYKATPAHDVYCFAMTMFEVFFLEQPFVNQYRKALPFLIPQGARPSFPSTFENNLLISTAIRKLIECCWHQDPTARPKFSEIADIFNSWLNDLNFKQFFVAESQIPALTHQKFSTESWVSSNSSASFISHLVTTSEVVTISPATITSKIIPSSDKTAAMNSDQFYFLGLKHFNGNGVSQDYKLAEEWYLKAANLGHVFAQYNLGLMYKNGTGVEKNEKLAVEWYSKAADQGNAGAKKRLAALQSKNKYFL
ncbi:hypothetical protein HK100_007101, partial [Physocladia obscura]